MLDDQARAVARLLAAAKHQMVGSTYILDRPGADVDYLYLVPNMLEAYSLLKRKGFDYSEGYEEIASSWVSVKREFDELTLNCIVTDDTAFYSGFANAANVCKYLHMLGATQLEDKAVRVAVHKIVRDSFTIEEATQ